MVGVSRICVRLDQTRRLRGFVGHPTPSQACRVPRESSFIWVQDVRGGWTLWALGTADWRAVPRALRFISLCRACGGGRRELGGG